LFVGSTSAPAMPHQKSLTRLDSVAVAAAIDRSDGQDGRLADAQECFSDQAAGHSRRRSRMKRRDSLTLVTSPPGLQIRKQTLSPSSPRATSFRSKRKRSPNEASFWSKRKRSFKAAKHVELTQPTQFQLMINGADGGKGESSPPA
jgi:hypothetical protein